MFDILLLGVWISNETLPLVFDILLHSVCLSDKTLLVIDMLLLGVWISNETLPFVFDILLLDVWISDKTLLLVFGYQMKDLLSCLICFFLLSGYHIQKLLLAFDVLHFSVFGYRMQHSISCLIVRNPTNSSDRKGSGGKWSAYICMRLGFWVACGDSIKKENNMGDNLLSL